MKRLPPHIFIVKLINVLVNLHTIVSVREYQSYTSSNTSLKAQVLRYALFSMFGSLILFCWFPKMRSTLDYLKPPSHVFNNILMSHINFSCLKSTSHVSNSLHKPFVNGSVIISSLRCVILPGKRLKLTRNYSSKL